MPTAAFLFLGIALSLLGLPRALEAKALCKSWGTRLLQVSVVMLGARIPIGELVEAGRSGLAVSFLSATLVLVAGYMLRGLMGLPENQAILITSGTAICGGSAIAAVGPTIQAKNVDLGVSVAVVFLLNAIAAVIFAPIGRALDLNDGQFALWSALAIHDTSSVVAAASQWSDEALRLATTIKLSRTLWILPLVLMFALRSSRARTQWNLPWFIGGFVLLSLLTSAAAWRESRAAEVVTPFLAQASHVGFSASLFLIGASIQRKQLLEAGPKPMAYGLVLWMLTLAGSLFYVKLLTNLT